MGVGPIILFAVMVIVAVAFIPDIFKSQEAMRTTYTATHLDYAAPVTAQGKFTLTGQSLLSTATVVNNTGALDCANNYTVASGVSSTTGTKRVLISAPANTSACRNVNISYTYGPEGYIDDSGGRSMAGLIGLFSVLALLGGAIYYWYRNNGGIFGG